MTKRYDGKSLQIFESYKNKEDKELLSISLSRLLRYGMNKWIELK